MKRLILPLLALTLMCGASWERALARSPKFTQVRATHPPVTRHKAHKAGRHHVPKRHRAHHGRRV